MSGNLKSTLRLEHSLVSIVAYLDEIDTCERILRGLE